jgi:steroid delta-isomerase-like uncharacterized protein
MKKLFLVLTLALILCFAFACQDKEEMAALEEFRAKAALEEQNKEIVKREMELWGKGDFEAFKELFAPEYVYHSPSAAPKPKSLEEAIEGAKIIHNAFPDSSLTIEELFAAGDRVVIRWIYKGTHEGEFMGIPPTGNKLEFGGIAITRIENGKIVEEWEDYDALGMMQQLGMELKPKEGKNE